MIELGIILISWFGLLCDDTGGIGRKGRQIPYLSGAVSSLFGDGMANMRRVRS